jgi:large subunit ribosomal protein L33
MAKKGDVRGNVTLVCSEDKQENYRVSKNKRNTPERLALKKYCPKCNKRTLHNEKK